MEQRTARGCPDKPGSPRAAVGAAGPGGARSFSPAGSVQQCPRIRSSGGPLQATRAQLIACLSGPFDVTSALPVFPLASASLSYTLRHYCASARARGPSRAHWRVPPLPFVRRFREIDRAPANRGARSHPDSTLVRRRAHGSCEWAGRGRGPGARSSRPSNFTVG